MLTDAQSLLRSDYRDLKFVEHLGLNLSKSKRIQLTLSSSFLLILNGNVILVQR